LGAAGVLGWGGTGIEVLGGAGGAGGVGTPRGVGGGAGGVAGGTGLFGAGGGDAGVAGGVDESGTCPGGQGVFVVALGAVGVWVAGVDGVVEAVPPSRFLRPCRVRSFAVPGLVEFSGVAVVPFEAIGAPAWLIGTHG
jgi:hypothetical protein